LQTRALAYADTQRHRLGVNFIEIPVNRPLHSFNPLIRDGACTTNGNLGGTANYFPSSFYTPAPAPQYAQPDEEHWIGTVVKFESVVVDADFDQARIFWEKTLAKEMDQQEHFVSNVASHLCAVAGDKAVQIRNAVYGT
jgi:catalase